MIKVLVCNHCGGPLPRPQPVGQYVTCGFCGATTDLAQGSQQPAAGASSIGTVRQRLAKELAAFEAAYFAGIAAGQPLIAAFRSAAEGTLSQLCDPDAITNVVFGIASEFDQKHGTVLMRDAMVLHRLATAYIDSLEQLSEHSEHVINLPFLTATDQGPLHFSQRVTIQHLNELAQSPPQVDAVKPWWKKLFSG